MTIKYKVAIIGGGVSGSTIALQLGNAGVQTVLFEKTKSLVNGPPMCHLHAGGNLYPDISIDQCKDLMRQSIEMVRLIPTAIDFRPTLITIPKTYDLEPKDFVERLKTLVVYYKELIQEDSNNKVLGEPASYYKEYSKEDVQLLVAREIVNIPSTIDEWMIRPAKELDWDKIKFPVFMVQEFGWNLFRLAAHSELAIEEDNNIDLRLNSCVSKVIEKEDGTWEIHTNNEVFEAEYLINAAGFRTGIIDDMVHINEERMVEFKAAYIAKWGGDQKNIPEIIFHGERGTPNGMAQLTPYPGGYYQIHGMTEDITLFENGLTESTKESAQPKLAPEFIVRIEEGWEEEVVVKRTSRSVEHIAQYFHSFSDATIGGKPLYGAQQIPGKDSSLRVAEVSFPHKNYARCEMVKASTALEAARSIHKDLIDNKLIENNPELLRTYNLPAISKVNKDAIVDRAKQLAINRNYPQEMSMMIKEGNSLI